MKSDFAKLLSNCQSRINEESVKVIQISNGAIVNSPSQSSGPGTSEVRPEIQGIINQKMRETQTANVSGREDKAQILFSLKDFLDNTSKESASPSQQIEQKEQDDDGGISDEDENNKNDSDEELDENDESVKDKSFKSTSSYKDDSDIEEVSIDEEDPLSTRQKPTEEDLETEISKLDNLQRKIHDTISDPNPRPSETVLLKMGASRPMIPATRPQTTTAPREDNVKAASKEVPATGNSNLNETITLDEEDNTEGENNSKVNSESSTENLKNKEKDKVEVSSKPVEKTKSSSLSEGMFKNISISIVGSGTKNVNIQNLLNSKSSQSTAPVPPTASNPSPSAHASSSANPASAAHSSKTAPASSGSAGATNTFTAGPNISLKRQGSPSKPFDTKRFKNSSIVITSSRKDAPTITLDELVNKEEDQEDEPPKENRAKEFNNCRCGDPLAYMCHDCVYRRWKVGYDFVKTRKPKPVVVEEKIEEVPRDATDKKSNIGSPQADKAAEILKNVNWSQVFSFAGIGVGQA